MSEKWDKYFFTVADAVSQNSPCLSRKIGGVAVRNGKILVATGYNGPPAGYPHCFGDVCPRRVKGYQSGEGTEICPAEHAERNVVNCAAQIGVSLAGCTLYLTCSVPCRECAKAIVNAGIKEVILTNWLEYPEPGLSGKEIFEKCGVTLRVGRKQ